VGVAVNGLTGQSGVGVTVWTDRDS